MEAITKTSKKIKKTPDLIKIDRDLVKNEQKPVKLGDFKIVNKMGRPTKYNADRCDQVYEYLELCRSEDRLPTIEGFSFYIGTYTDTITNWTKKHKNFLRAIKRLKTHQADFLQSGITMGTVHPAGGIFLLKNNHGFKDRHEVDHTSDGEPISKIDYIVPEPPPEK